MRLILIRHGESARNAGMTGVKNWLTRKGEKQSDDIAEFLAGREIDFIYCSPKKRCQQTLEALLANRNDVMQIAFSRLVGPKRKKESQAEMERRIEMFLDDLKYETEKRDTVVVISHGGTIRGFLKWILREERWVENGSISEIEIGEKKVKSVVINEIRHLNDK